MTDSREWRDKMKKYHIEGDYEVADDYKSYHDPKQGLTWGDGTSIGFIKCHGTLIEEPVTYRAGDRLRDRDGDPCTLIRLSGNRFSVTYRRGVEVVDPDAITQEEVNKMGLPFGDGVGAYGPG